MTFPRQIVVDLVEGDDAPDLIVRFVGLDMANYSKIELLMERSDKARIRRLMEADPEDAEVARVPWMVGDLIEGQHLAEFELTQILDDKKFTLPRKFPMRINVRRDLG